MAVLHALRGAGWHIWPFDRRGWPLAIEVWPRACTGPVRKRDPAARAAHVVGWPGLSGAMRAACAGSEDAFDAAATAIAMSHHADALGALQAVGDARLRREGIIWTPRAARGEYADTVAPATLTR
jgi:hypothetical protein